MLAVGLLLASSALAQDREEDWPRMLTVESGALLVVHDPQVVEWNGFSDLVVRTALSLESVDAQLQPTEILGTATIRARTSVDLESGTVRLSDGEVTAIEGIPEDRQASVRAALLGELGRVSEQTYLADLLGDMDPASVDLRDVDLPHAPPKLVVSQKAAILICFDGAPVLVPLEGTDLELALNTPSLLFRNTRTDMWYLNGWDVWLKTKDLEKGPWVPVGKQMPSTFQSLPDTPLWKKLKESIPGRQIEREDVPDVYVAHEPTELIVMFGTPVFQPVEGTSLTYVENTESDVFLYAKDAKYYVLLGGRWFRTRGAGEPLEFCTDDLPPDFADIPDDHPAARVRWAVPGTPEAGEALLTQAIPRVATVKRGAIELQVPWRGEPRFARIEGTPVEYATNAGLDVLRVGDRCYACVDGVWFEADKAGGPWALCDALPDGIASIPPDSPLFAVTFVRVEGSTEDSVTYSYTGAYRGTFASGGVVVWSQGRTWEWPVESWLAAWDARGFWLDRWKRDHLNEWQRHLPYGQGRWYDADRGLFRIGYDAMTHTKLRVRQRDAYRTWAGAAVLGADRRLGPEPEPEPEPKRPAPILTNREKLYAGPNGEVYKYSYGVWQRNDDGKWISLSRRPVLKEDVERRKKLDQEREARRRAYEAQRRTYRGSYGRRWSRRWLTRPGWGWWDWPDPGWGVDPGGGIDIGIGIGGW